MILLKILINAIIKNIQSINQRVGGQLKKILILISQDISMKWIREIISLLQNLFKEILKIY